MAIKMMAVDLDGTLLRSDKTISPYTLETLSRCREKGVLLAVATGRSEAASARFLPLLAPDVMISCSGALGRVGKDNPSTIYKAAVPPETAEIILRRLLASPSAKCVTVDTPDGYFSNHPIDPDGFIGMDYRHTKVTDFSQRLTAEAYKLVAELNDCLSAESVLQGMTGVRMHAFAEDDWYIYLHENANKWNALQAAAAYWHIAANEIAAFGDDDIDREMIRQCGVGVAMANATDEVKAAADVVCADHNHDGVACWLEEHIIGGLA